MTPLWRQGLGYGAVGGLQLLLDWLSFVALTAIGIPAAVSNVVGRIAGAVLGFWLNGVITFRSEGASRLGWARFGRFAASWSLMTVLSTLAVHYINAQAGLQWAWLLKPAVDIVLALLGFIASRYWIYR
ncbi:GtrA family protein [Lysobacter korlensis]|uniref:GtrA family protein n=1 Tax=Lysobacter korlensis TaxID=553636 RepID=A0ABV6RIQ7_9GAMM